MFRRWCNSKNTDTILLLIRVVVGIIFIYQGYNKLIHINETVTFFGSLNLAPYWAYIVVIVELLGGIFVFLGFFVNLVGALLALDTFLIVGKIALAQGLNGLEIPFLLLLSSLALSFFGAGKYSLQEVLKDKNP